MSHDRNAEIRDSILKSGCSGVAATVLVVAMCSPACLGGMIGTSLASSFGFGGANPASDQNTLRFPATPAPLTTVELHSIQDRLAGSVAEIDNMRAATDSEIDFIRSIANSDNTMAFHTSTAALTTPHVLAARDTHLELAELLLPKEPG